MRILELTYNGHDIAIVVDKIHAIANGTGDREGKATVCMPRLTNNVDEDIHVDQDYKVVKAMVEDIIEIGGRSEGIY